MFWQKTTTCNWLQATGAGGVAEPTRVADDGHGYTKDEFRQYYGNTYIDKWSQARVSTGSKHDSVGKPAAEASSNDAETMPDPNTLTFRIRWRLSGNIETISMLEWATVDDMKLSLEDELDETADSPIRVRLFLGSQEVTNKETLAALWCKMVAAENFELGAVVENCKMCANAVKNQILTIASRVTGVEFAHVMLA